MKKKKFNVTSVGDNEQVIADFNNSSCSNCTESIGDKVFRVIVYNEREYNKLDDEGQVNLLDLDWENEDSTFPLYYEDYPVKTAEAAINAFYSEGYPEEYVVQDVIPITKVDMSKYKEIKERGRKR